MSISGVLHDDDRADILTISGTTCFNMCSVRQASQKILKIYLQIDNCRDGKFMWLSGFYGISSIFWTVLNTSKALCYLTTGQKITRSWGECRELLVKMGSDEELDSQSERELHVLTELMNKPAIIKPLDCFELNWGTGLSMTEILFTDLIILLQFRVGE